MRLPSYACYSSASSANPAAPAYRIAHAPSAQSPTVVNPREVYHSLNPLAPLSPVPKPDDPTSAAQQRENETVYRQLLIRGALAVLLPTEDLDNECLTALVGQILSELIIGNVVIGKLSQPWMIWECLIITARVLGRRSAGKGSLEEGVVEAIAHEAAGKPTHAPARPSWSPSAFLWSVIHWVFLIFATGKALVVTLASSSSLPPRSSHADDKKGKGFGPGIRSSSKQRALDLSANAPPKTPILVYKLWACVSTLIELDIRMPWLSGSLSMLQLGAVRTPGRLAGLDGPLDR